ncbi:MAG TPA: hypothetical protein VN025_06660 [Candidatus Dormibacteraeota bacterium]|nr:hypothetical protein [Candidatus Dormibacteraeota bacterium]
MIRRFSNLLLCAITLALALTGCSKSADQAANSDSVSDSASSGTAKSKSITSAVKEAIAPKPIVVPEGTALEVVLDESLSSKTATPGQSFEATVESPVEVDGKVIIPKGAHAKGRVKDAKAAGRFKGASLLELALKSVEIDGKTYDINTSAPTFSHKGKGKRTAVAVGGGAGLGALIGGIAGGGKGAAIGAAAGAGAGAGGAAFTGKADVVLPAETALTFKLTQPLEIKTK